ncbi:MAG: enoyl-CoA hydratase/isomerase family protein [Candidatus Hydrogenedentota bacterium]
MSEQPQIIHEQAGDVRIVTLNRPEKRNALTIEMVDQLADAVCGVDVEPDVRAVIVRGEGALFSAGIDLMSLASARARAAGQHPGRWLRRMAEQMQNALNRLEATEVPVIGALHGRVIGLGLEVALCFDLRVADEDTQLSIPETRLGLVADVGGTTRLTRTIGPSRAKDMLMTARDVDAREALAWGLVNRVAETGGALAAAKELAGAIAKNAPLAVGMAKLVIDQGDGLDRMTQMTLERWAQSQLVTTEDMAEAMTAFMEKRTPDFKGR